MGSLTWLVLLVYTAAASFGSADGRRVGDLTTFMAEEWVAISGNMVAVENAASEHSRAWMVFRDFQPAQKYSPCGVEAWKLLDDILDKGQLHVEEIPSLEACAHNVQECGNGADQMVGYVSGHEHDELATLMVARGLATATESAPEQLHAVQRKAMGEAKGCLWRQLEPAEEKAVATRPSMDSSSVRPVIESTQFPTGVTDERILTFEFERPVDFVLLENGDIILAELYGRILYLRNGAVLRRNLINLESVVNGWRDRGIASLCIPPDFNTERMLYIFFVFEHRPSISFFTDPKTSRVMRTVIRGTREEEDSREVILGTVAGDGCDSFGPDADCIPAESGSHVGGACDFDSRGQMFVSVGDGGPASVSDLADRAQEFLQFSGKILKVTKEGRGLRSNPYYNGDRDSRLSKIWAIGFRNPFHCQVSPESDETLYCGDTQWASQEEVDVIRRGQNHGWPCYEGNLDVPEFADRGECPNLTRDNATFPVVTWNHEGESYSSISGPKIKNGQWPDLYQNALVYADPFQRWLGFVKLTDTDRVVMDIERVDINRAIVQIRLGADGALYYVDVFGGGFYRLVYTPSADPIEIVSRSPVEGAETNLLDDDAIVMEFNRSLDPRFVKSSVRLRNDATGRRIGAVVTHDYGARTVTIRPRMGRYEAITYRVEFTDGLRDLDGGRAPASLTWTFINVGLRVVRTIPASVAEPVSPGARISIFFSEPMNRTSLADGIVLRKFDADSPSMGNGGRIPFTETGFRASDNRFRFRADLVNGMEYVVTVRGGRKRGVKSAQGQSLTDGRFRFFFRTNDA